MQHVGSNVETRARWLVNATRVTGPGARFRCDFNFKAGSRPNHESYAYGSSIFVFPVKFYVGKVLSHKFEEKLSICVTGPAL